MNHKVTRLMFAAIWSANALMSGDSCAGTTETETLLSQVIEDRTDAVLARYLSKDTYKVEVELSSDQKAVEIPFLTSGPNKAYFESQSNAGLVEATSKISLTISISDQYDAQTRNTLANIVKSALKLRIPGPDVVKAGSISLSGLKIDEKSSVQMDQLEKELTTTKSELSKLSLDFEKKTSELARAGSVPQKGEAKIQPKSVSETLMSNIHFLVIAGIGFLAAIIITAVFAFSSRKVGSSIGEIAQCLEEASRNVSNANARSTRSDSAQENAPISKPDGNSSFSTNNGNVSIESQQQRLEDLRKQVANLMSASAEALFVRWLSTLISQPKNIAKAVVSMELLGQQKAGEIFHKLNVSDQDTILAFMKSGSYPRSKSEMMIEAGEELVTRLMADSLVGGRLALNSQISERLLQLSIPEAADVVKNLDAECYPRLLLYFDTQTINSLLKHLRAENPETYNILLPTLIKVPSAERNISLDKNILETMNKEIAHLSGDTHRAYLKFYQDLLEGAEEEQVDEIMKGIELEQPKIADTLRRKVVSVSTFFRLADSVQTEILASMSNRDIAALMLGLNSSDAAQISAKVSSRRQALVMEELQSLTEGSAANSKNVHRKAKSILIQKLRTLNDEANALSSNAA